LAAIFGGKNSQIAWQGSICPCVASDEVLVPVESTRRPETDAEQQWLLWEFFPLSKAERSTKTKKRAGQSSTRQLGEQYAI
jgi:hypothetical protein